MNKQREVHFKAPVLIGIVYVVTGAYLIDLPDGFWVCNGTALFVLGLLLLTLAAWVYLSDD